MSDNANTDNPYSPPLTGDNRYGMARRTFQIGRDEIHTICVETSLWRGLRTHTIDAAGNATPAQRGPCRFQLGQREQHQVEVQVDRTGRVNALVDGELVEHNMFPRVRAVIITVIAILLLVVTAVAIGLILAFLSTQFPSTGVVG